MARLGELFLKGNRKVFRNARRQNLINGIKRHTDDFQIRLHTRRYLVELEHTAQQQAYWDLKMFPAWPAWA